MKKKIMLLLVMAMLGSTGMGCASSDQAASSSVEVKESTTAETTAEVKDTVVIATAVEPKFFFMQQLSATAASMAQDAIVLYNLYDFLFFLDEEGKLQPNVGTDYTVSEDGLEYVVTIRDDVYFTNGDKMTAEDVAFSFNLCIEQVPPNAKGLLTGCKEVEVVDDTHVKFIMNTRFAAFPNCWTARATPLIDKSYYEEVGEEGYATKPIASGPYALGEVVSGESVALVANENYWGGAPAIKNVIIKLISNVSTQFISLQSKEVDVVLNANIASCLQLDSNVAAWSNCDSATRAFMMFQTNPAAGSQLVDENLRKAIACAVNRDDLIIGVCEGYGSPAVIDTVLDYTGAPSPDDCTVAESYDLEKAKEFLAASNYDDSNIRIYCTSGSRSEQAANIIQASLVTVGINCEVIATDGGTISAAMQSGEYDILMAESTGSLFDTSCLNNIYTSASFAQFESDEDFAWLKERIDAQMVEVDSDTRIGITAEILSYLNEHCLSVPLYCPMASIAYSTNLKGVVAHPQIVSHINDWSW